MASKPLTSDRDDQDSYDDVEETKYEIKTGKCGNLSVFVQGPIASISLTTPVFLTVHDIGTNHGEYHKLVEHPCMAKLKARSIWVHVELPGQEFDAPDLPEQYCFPSMEDIANDLIHVVNYFNIKYCVTLGEGAGANILARFSMYYADRVLGNVFIHCTPHVASMMQYFNDKIMTWKLSALGMNSTAEQYLVFHKFGTAIVESVESSKDRDRVIQEYIKKLEARMNAKNLRLYVESYLNRSELVGLKDKLRVDTLLVSGSSASHSAIVDSMKAAMDPKVSTRVKIDDCSDIFGEAPDTFAYNMLLFCQGLGLFSALPMSRSGSICS